MNTELTYKWTIGNQLRAMLQLLSLMPPCTLEAMP